MKHISFDTALDELFSDSSVTPLHPMPTVVPTRATKLPPLSMEIFDSVSEALTFTFANPREKIENQVFVLPEGVPVFPLILLRANILVNDNGRKGYFGAIDKQLTSDTEFICKGVNIFHVHKEIFTGFRDYRGRFPTSMQHACIIRLDTPVKMPTVPQVNNAIAIAFIADFDHLLVTNRVWMPVARSTDE